MMSLDSVTSAHAQYPPKKGGAVYVYRKVGGTPVLASSLSILQYWARRSVRSLQREVLVGLQGEPERK